jgi:putative DNA methylase
MSSEIKSPRKLIEVALPLDKINEAARREKTIRHGNPSNLHRWWARRPLAAARAVIFSQMVNDPGYQQGGGFKYGKNKKEAAQERNRLFRIMEELVQWENINDERVLEEARAEIRRSWREICDLNRDHPEASTLFDPDKLPGLHDPFAGGGAIPLEASRLGLEAFASDLNPVAVTINKAMIEIPSRFAGRAPVGPRAKTERTSDLGLKREWPGISGLSEDVRRYGAWMRDEAQKSIGHLYPPIEITAEMAKERSDLKPLIGQKLTIIAWLWARTVKSPNPAFADVETPLVSSFVLSKKAGKEAYVVPVVTGNTYRFTVKTGKPPQDADEGTKVSGRGANFRCLLSDAPIGGDYIKSEGQAGRIGAKMLAIVAEGQRGRVYLSPDSFQESVAGQADPKWRPAGPVPSRLTGGTCVPYGMTEWGHLFTPRQLVALTTFSDLVGKAISKAQSDARSAGMSSDERGLDAGGSGAIAYGEAIGVFLSLVVSKSTDSNSSLCPWEPVAQCTRQVFGRQAIPMIWDFGEGNPLHDSSGGFATNLAGSLASTSIFASSAPKAIAEQLDARNQTLSRNRVISTDPPYYDNIAYADLSDFFYVWLRPILKPIFPEIFATLAVPKAEELVAAHYRHGGPAQAEAFFLDGMTQALANLANLAHPAFPVTIYYAFKQSETKEEVGTSSTGWETFLEAVLKAGFLISGTWPMRTELTAALKTNTNSLASSIVLVCRKRPNDAPTVSRREFIRSLNAILPEALDEMTRGAGNDRSAVAPVDLSQSIIGPGMAIFSQYSAVLEADGSPMGVRTALQLINRFLAEDDFDPDTQFCVHWFEQFGWKSGDFGQADVLARSKATSVDGLVHAGVLVAGNGTASLLKWADYPTDWDPATDVRLPVWEALHHLIRLLKQGGDIAAGKLVAAIPGKMEAVRQLAYRLYTLCERQGWAEDARAYNELITSWSGIESAATNAQPEQRSLFE